MAVVKRSAPVAPEKDQSPGRRIKKPRFALEVELPTKPTVVSTDLRDRTILLHGERKWGKTTLFTNEEDTFFMEFDPEQPYEILQKTMPTWKHFMAYLEKMEGVAKGKFPYRNIVVDRVDLMYLRCFKSVCEDLHISHPNDAAYGKGWDTIKQTFATGVQRLMDLPAKTRWITHSSWKETQNHRDEEIERLVPELSKQADVMFTGLIDVVVACVFDGRRRVMVVEGDERITAGHRLNKQFWTTDGKRVREVLAGNSPEEAYKRLEAAFRNEQTYATVEEYDAARDKKAKVKRK